jgi:hypothetical protein
MHINGLAVRDLAMRGHANYDWSILSIGKTMTSTLLMLPRPRLPLPRPRLLSPPSESAPIPMPSLASKYCAGTNAQCVVGGRGVADCRDSWPCKRNSSLPRELSRQFHKDVILDINTRDGHGQKALHTSVVQELADVAVQEGAGGSSLTLSAVLSWIILLGVE